MRPASSAGDRAQGHSRRNGRRPRRKGSWLIQDGRPLKRYVTTVGAMLFSAPLILSGVVILQNAIGGWPDDPPLRLQVVIHDTVPGAADLDVEAVTELESRVAAVAADSLRVRARADSVSFYLLWPIARRAVSWDFRLLLLTFFMGALGAWIHAASSFVRYVGNREFTSSWGPWYLMRPLVGGALALVFYTVIRIGLVTTGGSTVDALSHYSAAAFAGLVGLFSERASKKLADVFDALFTPRPGDEDADRLGERSEDATGSAPLIKALDPPWVVRGGQAVPVVITGEHFGDEPVVRVDGNPVDAVRVSEKDLRIVLDEERLTETGTVEIIVARGTAASPPKRLPITP